MENNKKNRAIVFLANLKYRFALAEMLVNLRKTNNGLYDSVVIYHSDLSEDDIQNFMKIEPKCVFIEYTFEQWEHEYKKLESANAINFINRFSHLAYVKFRIFELLENYHKVLFLDLDMLILGDISEIFELDGIAWRSTFDNFNIRFNKYVKMDNYPQWFSNFPENHSFPNAGLIYISDKDIDWKKCLSDGHEFIMEFMDYFGSTIDELTFAWIVHKNKIPLTVLDKTKYNTLLVWYSYHTKIIHFMGRNKVWNNELLQTVFPQWMENYKEILGPTVFASEDVIEFSEPCLMKKIYEEFWLDFISKHFSVPQELKLSYDLGQNIMQMNYKADIFYEIVFNLYGNDLSAGVWIRDKRLLNNHKFIAKMKEIIPLYRENEKGIYLYTTKKDINGIIKEFYDLYDKTFGYITSYLERTDSELEVVSPYLSFNKEITDMNTGEYFNTLLAFKDKYTILIAVKDEASKKMKEFIEISHLPLSLVKWRESYVAVISGAKKLFEKTSDNKIIHSFRINAQQQLWITMISEGYRLGNERSSIIINNIDYSMNLRGLNFAVIDNRSGCVVDMFNIDTYQDEKLTICRRDKFIQRVRRAENDFWLTE